MASSRKKAPPEEELPAQLSGVLAAANVGADSRLCVALSGGVDSVVLLHLLVVRQKAAGYSLTAVHVHHGLSLNANAWRDFCRDFCAARGVPLEIFHVEVSRDSGAGLEAAAREARHEALSAVDADWLLLGHHQDDQAETLLFRLLRGTGVHGAAAMSAVEPRITAGHLRPLLNVRREAIVAYALFHHLNWVEDESNADWRFTRNRLRHDILPRLEAIFPATVATLARAAEHFGEADGLLDEMAIMDRRACGGDRLALSAVLALSDARLRNLLRWCIRQADSPAPPAVWLNEIIRQLRVTAGQPFHVSRDGIALYVYRGMLWLERVQRETEPAAEIRIDIERLRQTGKSLPWRQGEVRFFRAEGRGLSLERLENAAAVVVTTRWPGLCMRMAQGRPMRSFKNLSQEAAIPPWLRDGLPVLRVDGQAAWIAEIGISADFAARDSEDSIEPRWLR